MADLTSRRPEMDGLVNEFHEWSKAEQASGRFGQKAPVPEDQVATYTRSFEQERTNLRDVVSTYHAARVRRVDALVDGMATVFPGGKDAATLWRDATEGLADEAVDILSGALSGVERPSGRGTALALRFQLEEDGFASSLGGKVSPEGWAKLAALAVKVERTLGEMDIAWEELVDEAEEIDGQAASQVTKLVDAMKAAGQAVKDKYDAAARVLEGATEQLATLAGAAAAASEGKPKESLDAIRSRADTSLDAIAKAIEDLNAVHATLVAELERVEHALQYLNYLQDSEVGAVQRNWKRLHEGAENLARDPSPDRAAEDQAAATKRLLTDWSAVQPTPGLKADAEKLAGLLSAQTDGIAKVVKDTWSKLRSQNDGRWLGSLSSANRDQLLRLDNWKSRRSDVDGANPKAEVGKAKAGASKGFGLDLDAGVRKVIDAVNSRPGTESGRLDLGTALDGRRKTIAEQLSSMHKFLAHTAGRWETVLGGPDFERAVKRTAVDAGL